MSPSYRRADLPPGPPDKSGWPWMLVPAEQPREAVRGRAPRITIVTPSYNQGAYLEETIRSVLLQGYPNLDYHIIDGGSTDGSVEIIRKYEPWLTSWVSERDRGQSDAINKGFRRSNGEIFGWVCSDDLLTPGALWTVASAFSQHPDADAVVGNCYCRYDHAPEKNQVCRSSVDVLNRAPYSFAIWQPSCFFRRSIIGRPELVREDLHYCMDRELWCYLQSRQAVWHQVEATLSVNRFTGDNKSLQGKSKIIDELDRLYRAYARKNRSLTFWLGRVWLPLVKTQLRHRSRAVRCGSRFLSRSVTLLLRALFPDDSVRILQKEFYRYSV